MVSELDRTSEDLTVFDAQQLVKDITDAEDLADIVINDDHHWAARNDAAEKLITMWKDDRRGGVDALHLSIVAEHAEEPYRSKAQVLYSDYLLDLGEK